MATVLERAASARSASVGAPSPSQAKAVCKLPDNACPDWPPVTHRLDPAIYISLEHFGLEQDNLFKRLPLPIAPSALVPPGHYVCRDEYGVPIILSRDNWGIVKAFVNACRHRGARLVRNDQPVKGPLMVCAYHAWSYDLGGELKAIPRSEVFEPLDKCKLGLAELPCAEIGGIIFVKLGREADHDFSHIGDEVRADFDALGLSSMHLFGHRRHDVKGNWKLILDTFLEGYHVIRLHVNSLGSMFEDTFVQVDRLGNYLRQTSGRLGFTREQAQAKLHSLSEIRSAVTFVYTLLPNAALIISPDYATLLVMQPQSVGHTIVDEYLLTDYDPGESGIVKKWRKSWDLTGKAFPEDFWAAEQCQVGLETGAVPEVLVGGIETAMISFHELLAELLAEAGGNA